MSFDMYNIVKPQIFHNVFLSYDSNNKYYLNVYIFILSVILEESPLLHLKWKCKYLNIICYCLYSKSVY